MRYLSPPEHVHATHIEDAWITGQQRGCPAERTVVVKWNLRLAAANRGIWKASELQRMLAEAGLVIRAGKMSGLWVGQLGHRQTRQGWRGGQQGRAGNASPAPPAASSAAAGQRQSKTAPPSTVSTVPVT